MRVYLDNSATTRPFDEVTQYMAHVMSDTYGNPSSMHTVGLEAENEIRNARQIIASSMKVDEKEICFTSGGTESDNLAIIGSAMANKRAGMHLITTKTEHPAVLETMRYLEEQGFKVTYLDVMSDGRVDPAELKAALTEETILVSIMHVNNEIGSLNDVEELAGTAKRYNPSILFHTDAVQSFGKFILRPKKAQIDLLSVSGHKIHGPKGAGFVYINDKARVRPVIFGGGQQKGMRSGTENVPGIAGLGLATKLIHEDMEHNTDRMYALKEHFIRELMKMPDVSVNALPGHGAEDMEKAVRETAPHIISASFDGIRAEVLLHALEAKGIYVSAGSACSSNKPAKSATLQAINLRSGLLDSTLRFSLSCHTKEEEIDHTLEILSGELPVLRRYRRS